MWGEGRLLPSELKKSLSVAWIISASEEQRNGVNTDVIQTQGIKYRRIHVIYKENKSYTKRTSNTECINRIYSV